MALRRGLNQWQTQDMVRHSFFSACFGQSLMKERINHLIHMKEKKSFTGIMLTIAATISCVAVYGAVPSGMRSWPSQSVCFGSRITGKKIP